jgi:hypothetical protein
MFAVINHLHFRDPVSDETLETFRVARDVGGPFMTEHVVPLLSGDTDRSVGEVILESRA